VCSNITLTGPKNIRSEPNPTSPIVRTILEGGQLAVDFIGYYRVSDAEKWYRVRFDGNQYGWLSDTLFYTDPCLGLPELDVLGNPPPPTSTPTPTPTLLYTLTLTPTPTPILTPTPTPTLIILPTYTPPAPLQLCNNGSDPQWRKDLCNQGVRYLSPAEATSLTQAALGGQLQTTATFNDTDVWWLAAIGRGVGDVPPEAGWGNFDPTQCYGDTFCLQYGAAIVSSAVYLFRNMARIGIDLPASGDGQNPTNWLPMLGESIQPFAGQSNEFYACNSPAIPGAQAAVCWVCQDIPTQLYLRAGYDLSQKMTNENTIGALAYRSRNVISSYSFLKNIGSAIYIGSQFPYRTGEMIYVFDDGSAYHVGLVVRGGNNLDDIIIAQNSYSSLGFFYSRDQETNAIQRIGRFEVITLRTFLYKASGSVPPNVSQRLDEVFRHGMPR